MNEKKRASIEAQFKETNEAMYSVCSGKFYIKNKKTWEDCKKCSKCPKYRYYKYKDKDTLEVKHVYVDSFRKCELYKIDIIDGAYVSRIAIYQIYHMNDCAINAVKELESLIPKDDKQAIKIYSGAKHKISEYESSVYKIIGDKINEFADFNCDMDEYTSVPIDNMKKYLVNALNKEGYNEISEYIASVEVARTLVEFSTRFLEKRIEECRKFGANAVHLRQYKLNDLMRNTEGLSEWANRKIKPFNFAQKEVLDSFHTFHLALLNHKKINEILRRTITKIEL